MSTTGSKRARESDASTSGITNPPADVAPTTGVTTSAVAGRTRKKAKLNAPSDGKSPERPSAATNAQVAEIEGAGAGADASAVVTGTIAPGETTATTAPVDTPTTGVEQQSEPASTTAEGAAKGKRPSRKSALAAKDKIVAAETAADEGDQGKRAETDGAEQSTTKPNSGSLVSPAVVPGKSRGRGGDRPSTGATSDPAVQTNESNTAAAIAALQAAAPAAAAIPQPGLTPSAAPDPANPYLVRYGDPNNPYAHIAMAPGMMIGHNPYMPPPPAGYAMFPPGMIGPGGAPYPIMHMAPPGFPIPGQPPAEGGAQPPTGQTTSDKPEGAAENGTQETGEGNAAGTTEGQAQAPPAGQVAPQQHPYGPYAFPAGFPAHMPPPEFMPNPNNPHAPNPYGHAHLLPPMHHPHPPNPHHPHPSHLQHPGLQLTLPLAVTDHTMPSHLDVLIRAPDSLTITYSEVPDGAYLLRSDFGEPYPKQLEPPRKTTEMRCLFCKRHYSGPNARGMWRRHVTGKHDFVFERKGGALGGHTGGRSSGSKSAPNIVDSENEGDDSGGNASPEAPHHNGQEGQQHPGEMTMLSQDSMMGLLSMNGMPVHTMHGQPIHGMAHTLAVLPGTNIPIASIPPHPIAPGQKRRSVGGRPSGVGMGNGGGGLVPRVHPLLSKEERIERARASKRHYAMKRRALEKMKQGGIPKGARLVEGMFVLADGTQIPADPNVEYRDLTAGSSRMRDMSGIAAGGAGNDEEYDEKKRGRQSSGRKRAGRKKMDEEIDDDDEEDDLIDDIDPNDVQTEGLVSMEAPPGVSVDMDPWADSAAVFQAQAQASSLQQPVIAQVLTPQVQAYPGKLAEVPIVIRGQSTPGPSPSEKKESPSTRTRKAAAKALAGQDVEEGQAPATLPPGIIPPGENEEERKFCYCDDVEYGNMIGCDNGPNCSREWFHLACTDIEGPIPSKWYCRDCRAKMEAEGIDPDAVLAEEASTSAQPAVDQAPQEEEPPKRRRGRPPKPKPAPPAPEVPVETPKKGKKAAKKKDGPEPEEENEIESEDEAQHSEQVAAEVPPPAAASKASPEGRTRRSTRGSAAQGNA